MATGMGGGLAAADFDDDGDIDLFVPNAAGAPDQLYRNLGNGQFEEIVAAAGLASMARSRSALWFDYDGDHRLDLVTSLWLGEAGVLLNNGNGTFTNISVASGIGGNFLGHWQPVMYDFDGDGRLDIFYAIDYDANRLWINQSDNTFVDRAVSAGVDHPWNDMGVALGDYDNDGDPDIYVTNISLNTVLYHNNSSLGVPSFAERAQLAGVNDAWWGWGTTFVDADNDGWLDLVATNGFTTAPYDTDPSKFFRNLGGSLPTFQDRSDSIGFNDDLWGSSLVAIDYNRDGHLDLVQSCNASTLGGPLLRLLENQQVLESAGNNYLVVRPRMSGPNHRAIGAVVRVEVGSTQLMRPILAGISFLGQEPAEAFFGLGTATQANRVIVEWPDGSQTEQTNVAANQVLTILVETDTDNNGLPDALDPDDDGDGIADGPDCSPSNAQAWQVPGEVTDLSLTHTNGVTTLQWSPPASPGGTVVYYDTIVSSRPDTFAASATCVESNGSDALSTDSTIPGIGTVLYFVTRAGNSCDDGTCGDGTSGGPRAARSCQ